MTKAAAKQDYFEWLCDLAGLQEHEGRHYLILAKDLHKEMFIISIERDENRAADGVKLREDYERENGVPCAEAGPCTVLELLIGISLRIDFELADIYDGRVHVKRYFWELLKNLGLDEFDDEHYFQIDGWFHCKDILDRFMKREYRRNGTGGLFPLKQGKGDQRKSEIWYQMQAYLQENYGY